MVERRNNFLLKVAETNKLELLKWIREEKKCEWDSRTINTAAYQGNLEMVKYCVQMSVLLMSGRVQMLPIKVVSRYSNTCEEVKAPWGSWTAPWAAENGHLHILEYLVERKYDKYNEGACTLAAKNGHLDCLKYLRETAKAPWTLGPYEKRTKTNKPSVYNTSSTRTAHYHMVGDTNVERYTRIRIIIIIIIIIGCNIRKRQREKHEAHITLN